ncbi:MAG: DUF1887 family protein [Eubacterium sp.]|nr:DUF1887 family protein [Eubacterium sp.]
MTTNFEFLGTEPIENVITSMHFQIDRVIYFGYQDVMKEKEESTKRFLKRYCGVSEVAFYALPDNDLQGVLKTMREVIEKEKEAGHDMCFDITGGESLILVAFGMLAAEYHLPMHTYDVEADELVELNSDSECRQISQLVRRRDIAMDLDKYIEMQGGIINHNMQKSYKDHDGAVFFEEVKSVFGVQMKYTDNWNRFSDYVKTRVAQGSGLEFPISQQKKTNTWPYKKIFQELEKAGLIAHRKVSNRLVQVRFKNKTVKSLITDGGSSLELYVYQMEREKADDCRIGVHLDWDGVIGDETDVCNEIDVLTLQGNIPTFISCKSGKMGANHTRNALYELETVAKRFGGKYAKKVLVIMQPLGDGYQARADEMKIEIRNMKK